ncbi:MAG: ABC transporter ATP-binding protein [Candidatus Krumholzibacteriia bacterium]
MEPLLEARGVGKVYRRRQGEVRVLARCDFALAPGEAVAITGPSGAGKSTLLNVLGGLDAPTDGVVLHRGRELARHGDRLAAWRNRELGFVFQSHFLLPDFTALENVLLPARMAGPLDAAARDRAAGLLEALGLAGRADHLPGELSGGEQQRVAVARAFMNRPGAVLADEPFGNLDRAKGEDLSRLLFELRAREGTALVIVTHDRSLAARADRTLLLGDGRLAPAAAEGGRAS